MSLCLVVLVVLLVLVAGWVPVVGVLSRGAGVVGGMGVAGCGVWGLVVSGFPAHALPVGSGVCLWWVGVCSGCWLRTA